MPRRESAAARRGGPVSALEDIGLPKWPALLVVGERVTPDQAAEIIVRTANWPLSTNDHDWAERVHLTVGAPPDPYGRSTTLPPSDATPEVRQAFWHAVHEANDAFDAAIGVIPLEYLANSRIASSWIGGPHGWCNWSGAIGCNNFNIGKWPSTTDVRDEWKAIAAAFPFLCLQAQLLDREQCEVEDGPPVPLVQYLVARGEVSWSVPTQLLCPTRDEAEHEAAWTHHLTDARAERGCTIEQVKRGVELARARKR
jgi:hypothetical protein